MSDRILIIEDNPANLELMKYLLTAYGYSVLTAGDGESGLQTASAESPDLIICDLQMPGLNGYQVVARLKEEPVARSIPIIAVTAFAMVGDREKVLAAGFNGYLSKPIDPEKFIAQVGEFLGKKPPPAEVHQGDPGKVSDRALPPSDGKILLVVDNNRFNLELASALFEGSGYNVITASGISEALSLAQQVKPDLILSDVCMSGGTGFEFLFLVKSEPSLRDIPFLFISCTRTDPSEVEKGLAMGAHRYLIRPLEPAVLLGEIAACLEAANA